MDGAASPYLCEVRVLQECRSCMSAEEARRCISRQNKPASIMTAHTHKNSAREYSYHS